MRVLLLHPKDALAESYPVQRWDLVVDMGRAPVGTYQRWSQQAGCPVISIYDHAEETEDLYRLRDILRLGSGRVTDQWGIDWWEVLSLEIAPQLQQLGLVNRLSKALDAGCELYSSQPHFLATAVQKLLDARLTILESGFQSVIRWAKHSRNVLSQLNASQLLQVLEDKLDGEHSIRRRFAGRRHSSRQPIILLPSAYVNVSRTALSYAELLPDHQFLLVHSRSNAKLTSLPKNVRAASLTPYFVQRDKKETACLIESWNSLRKQLVAAAEEFNTADAVGLLQRIPSLLPWGIALRDAWNQVFESENVTACFSADDSNPPSSIPLILAKKRGVPALACHHGALNYMMAIKANHADFYLAKSEMERDYLKRTCHVAPEKIAAPSWAKPGPLLRAPRRAAPWLVFFSEPYQSYGWRSDEVYRDILPRLRGLAQACGLKLVFKLHPFESIKGHRRMLRRLMPALEHPIEVLAGPPSDQLWNNTRLALTVQSSTAVECAALGIPVFLCAWLRDSYSGYVRQYGRFGVGYVLESSEQIADIPTLLMSYDEKSFQQQATGNGTDPADFARLLSGTYSLPVARVLSTFSSKEKPQPELYFGD
jgi:hypothetical protein